jgi:hypothetical protein
MVDGAVCAPVLTEVAARVWERVADVVFGLEVVMVAAAAEQLFALDRTQTINASPSGQQA